MRRHRRHARRRFRWVPPLVVFTLVLLVLVGGAAFAGYRYDEANSSRILPGVTIAGADVGGMTRAEAVRALSPVVRSILDRTVEIRVGDMVRPKTLRALGSRVDLAEAVDRALQVGGSYGWPTRVYHRLLRRPVQWAQDLEVTHRRETVSKFIGSAAEQVERPPQDASVDFAGGRLVTTPSVEGATLRRARAIDGVMRALRSGRSLVQIAVWPVEPDVTEDELGKTIVIRIGENKLYLYDGSELVKSYPVATGQPRYPTPMGRWTIINKRINPTWVNPARDSWGANSPAFIPPGPDNPLGTRALDLNAPAIRIHGTYDADSIGTYASHGCIRMHISDSEELFGLVDVGTTVIITD